MGPKSFQGFRETGPWSHKKHFWPFGPQFYAHIDQGKSLALEVTAINKYYTKNLFIEYTDSQVNTSLLLCPGISLFFISIISNFWNVEPIIFRYIP